MEYGSMATGRVGGMMRLTSPAFAQGETIPAAHTARGKGQLPPLVLEDVPEETQTLALIVFDPDAPRPGPSAHTFDHWVVWNIPAEVRRIEDENSHQGVVGRNSVGKRAWSPPGPPPGSPPHRYVFHVYALDAPLDLGPASTRADVQTAVRGHVLAEAELMGTFAR
jgi:Raf kinase inhibitor-like YbhB/YbcL family protein